jgi:hypothetical protein
MRTTSRMRALHPGCNAKMRTTFRMRVDAGGPHPGCNFRITFPIWYQFWIGINFLSKQNWMKKKFGNINDCQNPPTAVRVRSPGVAEPLTTQVLVSLVIYFLSGLSKTVLIYSGLVVPHTSEYFRCCSVSSTILCLFSWILPLHATSPPAKTQQSPGGGPFCPAVLEKTSGTSTESCQLAWIVTFSASFGDLQRQPLN